MLFINYLHQIYNAMTKKDAIKVFEDKKIRAVWDDQKEEWYFSIVDVVSVQQKVLMDASIGIS